MIKGLKIAMIIYAAIGVVYGVMFIFFPEQFLAWGGFEKGPEYIKYILALLGISFIAPSVLIIIAAVRDPLKHIMWVQLAIALPVLFVAVVASSIGRGLVTFQQGEIGLITNAVFAVVLLVLYPWRATKQ